MVKAILTRSQMEIRNIFLENGGKEILLKSSKELGCICSCSSILWKVELGSDEIRYLAEEIFKQNVKEAAWFLLITYGKVRQKRNDLKIELLIRMKAELKRFQKFLAYPYREE